MKTQAFLFFFILCLVDLAGGAVVDLGSLGHGSGFNANPHNLSSRSSSDVRAVKTERKVMTAEGEKIFGGDDTRICVFCHTPHGASGKGPLWGRPDSLESFPTYGQNNGNHANILIDDIPADTRYSSDGAYEYPNGSSRLCLSCHDGVTAIGALLGGVGIDMMIDGVTIAGADLSGRASDVHLGGLGTEKIHPFSFVYSPPSDPARVVTYLNDNQGSLYTLPSPDSGMLDSEGRMQCTSCHDPHLDTREGSYALPFWKKNTGDEGADYDNTCLECHDSVPFVLPHDM